MKPRRGHAFTLVELLVVIAIIALLAGLLLPALAAAKTRAQQTKCLSDLRQWGLAMTLYADESGGFVPRERGGSGLNLWPTVTAETNRDVWYNVLPLQLARRPAREYDISDQTRLEFHTAANFFQCPAARFKLTPADMNAAPHFSRAMNSRLVIDDALIRLNDFSWPTRTPLLLDAGIPGEIPRPGQSNYDGRPHVKWDRASLRHGGRGNVIFADLHTAAVGELPPADYDPR